MCFELKLSPKVNNFQHRFSSISCGEARNGTSTDEDASCPNCCQRARKRVININIRDSAPGFSPKEFNEIFIHFMRIYAWSFFGYRFLLCSVVDYEQVAIIAAAGSLQSIHGKYLRKGMNERTPVVYISNNC